MQQNRVPLSITDEGGPWPSDAVVLSRLLAERYSCRAFQSRPVPRPVIERMLEMAQMTPSWCNSQPWQVIITEGDGTERFRDVLFSRAVADAQTQGGPATEPDLPFPAAYRGIYKERQREVGWQLYGSLGIANGDRVASGKQVLENFRLFGAPHALIVTSERDLGIYGAIDCGLYMSNLLNAAQSLGLGIIPQAALATYGKLIRTHFNIPEERLVVMGASFGFADDTHSANSFRSRRAPFQSAVQWVES